MIALGLVWWQGKLLNELFLGLFLRQNIYWRECDYAFSSQLFAFLC